MKAYKSLEAHNYLTSGWVSPDIKVKVMNNNEVILLGKVSHSQSLRVPPLKVWILGKSSGEIVTAHCNCMAGCSSACSHVGAVLFALEVGVRIRESKTSTDRANEWLPPHSRVLAPRPLKEIDFSSSISKYNCMTSLNINQRSFKKRNMKVTPMNDSELDSFLSDVAKCNPQACILAVTPRFSDHFVPSQDIPFPLMFGNLFNPSLVDLEWPELEEYCCKLFQELQLTEDQVKNICDMTTKQYKQKLWFQYRAGRITASIMKAACHTSLTNPAKSLIKKICYPFEHRFKSPSVRWGCEHESHARSKYEEKHAKLHHNFIIKETGFHVLPDHPFIGATPDGLVECNCCGQGVVEVKCPWCQRQQNIDENTPNFLVKENGIFTINKNSNYYYQMQTQIFVCNVEYCDFVVWTEKSLHIERIYRDFTLWNTIIEKARNFFKFCILPELTTRWYSKQ
ncbi:uncharacterized protein [Centruroides vittatus]|uniref:uncharacterized protein n=1 Tax=Centruroides vittatus TaxID=120091 RepID=UPI00350F9800